MLDWKEIVQDYIIKHSDQIKRVTRPIRDSLKVEYFTYHRIDKAGKYTVLLDRPDWAEHYVDEKFFLKDPYLRHPDVYKSGLCFVESHGSEEHKNRVLKAGKELFNLDQCVMLIVKEGDAVEFFGFAGNKATASLDRLYLNHPQILKSFAAHFKREFQNILIQMEGEASSLKDLKGSDFYCNEPIDPNINSAALLNYLKGLGKEQEIAKIALLSNREKQCIKLLIAGHTAKDTAAHLKLSPRTVEFYFENIKNKLVCSNKQEIVDLARKFEELGLFDLLPQSIR